MKTKLIFLNILILISFITVDCSLDLAPISETSSSSFWKTEDDAKAALYGMYGRLRNTATIGGQGGTDLFCLGEARSETMSHSSGNAGSWAFYFENQLTLDYAGPNWIGLYRVIHEANLLIKYIPTIKFSSEDTKNNYLAQAYAMRAFVYFVMVKSWGDVPLRKEPLEAVDPMTIHIPRTPKAEVFSFIKSDIDESLALFPNDNYPDGRFLWSKPAVNALKADVYLWTGKRENGGTQDITVALNSLNDIEGTDVKLLDDFPEVFSYTNKGNKEILFAIRLEENESSDYSNGFEHCWIMAYPGGVSSKTKKFIGTVGGTMLWTASPTLKSQYSDDDLRKDHTFYEIYSGTKLYATVITKFRGMVSGGVRKFIDDVVIYRYADVLLMKAEAKNALDQDPTDEMNKIRKRAYGGNYDSHVFVNSTKEINDDFILKERLLELAFEGKRWWDLIRFNKAFDLVPSLKDRKGDEYLLLFPISRGILTSEPKVTPNPGYY